MLNVYGVSQPYLFWLIVWGHFSVRSTIFFIVPYFSFLFLSILYSFCRRLTLKLMSAILVRSLNPENEFFMFF